MRVLVADDHSLFRDGLVSLLKAGGFTVVGQAENGQKAVEKALELQPELILLDIHMPVMDGLQALRQIRAEMSEVKIVMLTVSDNENNLLDAIKSGANGYLLKNLNSQAFIKTLEGLQRGEAAIARSDFPKVMKSLVDLSQQQSKQEAGEILSSRELEILRLVAEGLSNAVISERISLSENTVKYHIKNILQKLNAHSRMEAVMFALKNGLLKNEPPRA
jgi:DNA-binding NarL/FixJ family response regulator